MSNSDFNKVPTIHSKVTPDLLEVGDCNVLAAISHRIKKTNRVAFETYQGVDTAEFVQWLSDNHPDHRVYDSRHFFKRQEEIRDLVFPFVTDDAIFGYLSDLEIADFLSFEKVENELGPEKTIVIGPGASTLIPDFDFLIYADIPRWEIQQRQRRGTVSSLGLNNADSGPKALYKQSYFVDWRVLDRVKIGVYEKADLVVDCSKQPELKMIDGLSLRTALQNVLDHPFEMVPFFDPGVWGGEWMRSHFNLDSRPPNFAWCFNCVPEENHIRLGFGDIGIDVPAINLVFFHAARLLGEPVFRKFGREFPIRFDFLDTLGGGNLSLQVHPLKDYIKEQFGLSYTQEESYYLLHAEPETKVFLGLKEDIQAADMRDALEKAQQGNGSFPAEDFVESWSVKTHDHLLIPPGTPHCSGADTMVLEISATPYIFTFKMWDWDRVDLDGKPRPINIDHALNNIQWDRTTDWVSDNLVNQTKEVARGDGWVEEQTGLHKDSFIETRRHWFSQTVDHDTGGAESGSVNVLNLVQGEQVLVESPCNSFDPFVVNYAETFLVPASIGAYRITPHGPSQGQICGTVKAYVRS